MAADFEMVQGDTVVLEIPVVDENGDALDISTATSIDFTVVDSVYVDAFAKDLDDGVEVATSTVTVTLAPADTINLRGRYKFELQVIDGDSNVFTPLQGSMTIKRGYTD